MTTLRIDFALRCTGCAKPILAKAPATHLVGTGVYHVACCPTVAPNTGTVVHINPKGN